MVFKVTLTTLFTISVLGANQLQASTCLTGGCHEALTSQKYVHGPVAAEQAGVMGCVACHIPAGAKCTENSAGIFKTVAPAMTMCQSCHAKGNDSLHSAKELDCLECHDPHGSDTSPVFKRQQP